MRFHVGFSFRFKDLKKFLIPILLGILAYFGFGGLFGCIKVNAFENLDSSFNLTYNNFYENENYYHGNDSLAFVMYMAIDYYRNNADNSNFELFINKCDSSICLYLLQKNDINYNVNVYGSNGSYYVRNLFSKLNLTNNNSYSYRFYMPFSSNYDVINSAWFSKFKSCVVSDGTDYNSDCLYNVSGVPFYADRYTYTFNTNLFSYDSMNDPPRINNVDDFTFSSVVPFYYSSFNIYFRTDQNTVDSNSLFVKKIKTNGMTYSITNRIFSYFDVVNGNTVDNYNLITPENSLGYILVGGIPKADIGNFNITLNYNYNDFNYVSNNNFVIQYFGRVNHSSYYSYEYLQCTPTNNNKFTSTYNNLQKYVSTSILPDGFSCTSDLTNYDYIYLSIVNANTTNFDDTVYNINVSSNYGNITRLNNKEYMGFQIYEKFTNLDPRFEIMLSTMSVSTNALFNTNSRYVNFYNVNRDTNSISKTYSANPVKFGTNYNTNVMLFNLPDYYGGAINLDLYFRFDAIMSIGDNNPFTTPK